LTDKSGQQTFFDFSPYPFRISEGTRLRGVPKYENQKKCILHDLYGILGLMGLHN
jgi:hypothetical protein